MLLIHIKFAAQRCELLAKCQKSRERMVHKKKIISRAVLVNIYNNFRS